MSDAKQPTPEEFEAFKAEVSALREKLMPVLSGSTQGTALAVCFQIVYEQMQDPEMPKVTLEFVHQHLIALHEMAHQLLELHEGMAAFADAITGGSTPPSKLH